MNVSIRAQLLSIFIHNPIVFLGYNIGDRNIKDLLKTIFTYVDPLSENAERIRSNFLLVEHDGDSNNIDVVEHDIDLEEFPTIRINKLKTDNFKDLYNSISSLQLKVSAMDIRKVQNIVKDIYTGGSIRVNITEDLDELSNEDKVLVIGSKNTVSYKYHKPQELMKNYFIILEEHNVQILELVDAYSINSNQYFPIFGFDRLNPRIQSSKKLKQQQRNKISLIMGSIPDRCKIEHSTIEDIGKDDEISLSLKINTIFWGIINGNIEIDDAEKYLINFEDKSSTNYRKVLCAFDFKKYGNDDA